MEIEIEDYLSKDEIKSIVEQELRSSIRSKLSHEEDVQRIFSNLCYRTIFKYIDEIVPNSKGIIQKKTLKK